MIDQEPNKQLGEFDDLSKVEKFELNEEEYDKKQGQIKVWIIASFNEDNVYLRISSVLGGGG